MTHTDPAGRATPCSLQAREAGEDLAGTAPHATTWILVEQPGPWGRDALTDSPMPPGIAAHLRELNALPGVTVLLTRHPTRTARTGTPERHIWVSRSGTTGGSLLHATVTDISGVREMIPSSTHPEFAGLGVTEVSRRMAFVCTHSGRDACCALWGRELVGACAGLSDEVWECSHIGGHRFAPTALLTPGNLVVGRCTEGVIQDWVAHGSVDADALRGHAHLSASEQAAAVFALRQEADDQSALTTVQGDPDDPNSFLVSTTSGGTWHVTISREALRALRAESCGRDPGQADHFSLVRIAQL